MPIIRVLLASAVVLAVSTASANDAAVKDAAEGFRFGDLKRVTAALSQVRGHVLENYVEYWALRLQIDSANRADIERFLKATAGTSVGDRMRVDWLKQLGKTGDWERFEQISNGFDTDDSEVSCYRTTLAARSNPKDPLPVPRGVWEDRLTESCADAFAALARRKQVSAEDAVWRFRSSGDGGTILAASRVAESLGEGVAPNPDVLQRAHGNPESFLRGAGGAARPSREAALYALTRLARSDVVKARAAWMPVRSKFSDEEQRYAAGQLAYASARRLDIAESLDWAKRATDGESFTRLGDWQAAWIVRAALRAGAWREVLREVNAMSPSANGGQMDPAWRYWKARALAETGDKPAAQPLYAELAKENTFYGLLAAEEINAPLPPHVDLKAGAVKPTPEDFKQFDQSPAAKRVLKLSELGLRADAAREWYSVVKDFNDKDSLVASEWMRRKGIWDRSINTAERTKSQHDYSLRFQMPYADEIKKAATQVALDHALVFGLIRQESRFWAEAVSSAGALGLMQVMPATGKWIAAQLKTGDYRPSHLGDVAVNTGFGAYYLRTVLDQMGGSEPMAAASYNAGPGRARAWRADVPLEGAIYAESIPFNETRDYVKKVLTNAVWYAHLSGSGSTSLKQRLGIIPAK